MIAAQILFAKGSDPGADTLMPDGLDGLSGLRGLSGVNNLMWTCDGRKNHE